MKNLKYIYILCLLFMASCDYLDIVPNEIVKEEDIWENIKNAEQALARLYNAMPQEFSDDLWGASDECWHHWENHNQSSWKYNSGSWGPTDNPFGNWVGRYQDIRRANLFIENIESVPLEVDQQEFYTRKIPQFKAEARFLRAFYYFDLLKKFGAVPLLTESFDVTGITDSGIGQYPRTPFDEIVKFIVDECDEIKFSLKVDFTDEVSEMGRITRGAALALKSRVLLYAASLLFNGNTMYAGIKNKNGEQLFNQTYDHEKWKKAAEAAEEVIRMADEGVYKLNNPDATNPVYSYSLLFYNREWKETILPYTNGNNRDFEVNHFPNGYPFNGLGKMSIFQELVDSYETINGLPIEEDPSYVTNKDGFSNFIMWDGVAYTMAINVSNMYKNRDPRFYASIFFQHGNWAYDRHKRPVIYSYYGNRGNQSDDTDGWPWSSGTHNMTGYGMRKWNSPEVDILNQQGDARRNIPVFRLAEIYLNLAEAWNEYLDEPDERVYNAINEVRARVNMPLLPLASRQADLTKEGMRERIRNERRVELVFEGHRFWDTRRWMIAGDHDGKKGMDNRTMYGMHNRPTQEELEATGFDPKSKEAGIAVFYQLKPMQTRVFQSKHYLFPIPKTEIDKNPNLVQNYGW